MQNYKKTLAACFFSYISSAIVVNLPPLFFIIFSSSFNISLEKIGMLIIIGFVVQILTDLVFSKLAVKLGYRFCSVLAHVLCTVGIILLGVLPLVLSAPFVGLVLAFVTMSIGAGLIEVLISPIVDALPNTSSTTMSFLHSFYCWGAVLVIIFTTVFFLTPLKEYWFIIPMIWAVLPLIGIFMFAFVPFPPREEERKTPYKKLFTNGLFWCLMILMITSGASEQVVAQWASLFAEMGLNVSKTVGNLLGPCAFAVLMGISRILYGIFGRKFKIKSVLIASMSLTVFSYVLIVFVPIPAVNLIGCALTGLGVGIAWPGVLSLSSKKIPTGGTTMFALLALAGDVGCAIGPGLVGVVSGLYSSLNLNWLGGLLGSGDVAGLKSGIMLALIFPIAMIVLLLIMRNNSNKKKKGEALYSDAAPKNKITE